MAGNGDWAATFNPPVSQQNRDFHKFFVGFAAGWRFTGDK